jgi:hypothetical protein
MLAVGVARAGMVTTETALQIEPNAADGADGRDRLRAFLRRQDVRAELIALGVDPTEAAARVESLSDAEVASMNARINNLPAGAGVAGTLGTGALLITAAIAVGILGLLVLFYLTIVIFEPKRSTVKNAPDPAEATE